VPGSPGTALYIRPTLIATDPMLGVRASSRYTFFIILSPVGAYYGTDGLKPLKIWVEDRYVRAAKGGMGAVKAAGNYAGSLLASEEAKKRGYSQVLWLDAQGHRNLEEVGTMNLFLRIGDEVVTPALEGTILAGVTRDSIITLLRGWGMKVSERRISMDEIIEASKAGQLREVFGTGTAAVISPVGELGWAHGSVKVGSGGGVGDLTRKLYETLQGIQYGHLPDVHGWLSEVPPAPLRAHEVRAAASERREIVVS
jgi:branched-chain amino acid aminotransferase